MREVAIVLALLCLRGWQPAQGACDDSHYIGFDSRVSARLLARLPVTRELVTGFAVAGDRPIVLLRDRLLIYGSGLPSEVRLPYTATGLSVDAGGRLRVQHGGAVDLLSDGVLRPDTSVNPAGRLFGSNMPVLLDAFGEEGVQKFVFLRPGADSFGLAGAHGELRAAFWGDAGMAAVVEQSLYVWEDGSKQFVRLAMDRGLARAQSVCLVTAGHAVVALLGILVVVTGEDQIVLAGMAARCDAHNGILYAIDERTGEIWSVAGIEKMGNFHEDERHARSLILGMPANAGENAPAFLEAARIIGCDRARKLFAERTVK